MSDLADEGQQATSGPPALDPTVLMRSRQYRGLLVLAALVGVVVSLASWGFLELAHDMQHWMYVDLPTAVGFDRVPWWWPLPVLLLAGVLIAFAVVRLPGRGGHEPWAGLHAGPPTPPVELPGVILAAAATIGLGLVLGPEAPLLALGTGVALLMIDLTRRPVPEQARLVVAAAGSFAALGTVFGSPVIGAVIIIEAAGLGGPTLPLILLPGLLAAGAGSLVFVGMGRLTGLSTDTWAVPPLNLPSYPTPQFSDFLWTIVLALVAAVVTFLIFRLAERTAAVVARREFLLLPAAALLVGLAAIAFAQITGETSYVILFSGQEAMADVVHQAAALSLATLTLLVVCKGVAWTLSLAAARGGAAFPAIFLGLVGGLMASRLPGLATAPAVGVLVGAATVSVLKLPLSAIILTLLVTQVGPGVAPLVIVAVVVAYIGTLVLTARSSPTLAEP